VTFEEAVQACNRDHKAALRQFVTQFLKRDVSVGFPEWEDIACAFLDMMRAHITALSLRLEMADIAPLRVPSDRRRRRNAKTSCSSTATHCVINRGDQTLTQIH